MLYNIYYGIQYTLVYKITDSFLKYEYATIIKRNSD